MWRTKLWVFGGTLVHVRCGEVCVPACVYFAGICEPSGNDVDVNRIGGGAGAPPPRCPPPAGACAAAAIAIDETSRVATIHRSHRIQTSPLRLWSPPERRFYPVVIRAAPSDTMRRSQHTVDGETS